MPARPGNLIFRQMRLKLVQLGLMIKAGIDCALTAWARVVTHIIWFNTTTLVNNDIMASRYCCWPYFNDEEMEF